MKYDKIRRVRPAPGELPPEFTKQKFSLAKIIVSASEARVQVGKRLCETRDKGLFRLLGFKSMDQFIRHQGLSRSQCYRLMRLTEETRHE